MVSIWTNIDWVICLYILKTYFHFVGGNHWELFSDAKACGSKTGLLCEERKHRLIQQAAFVVCC